MEQTLADRIVFLLPQIQKIARHYAQDEQTADDYTQAAVEKILLTCSPTDTKSYILSQATWTIKNQIRAASVYMRYIGSIEDGGTQTEEDDDAAFDVFERIADAAQDTPETILLQSEHARALAAITGKLAPVDQQIIRGLYLSKSHQQIAEEIGISRSAVSLRVRNLRGSLLAAGIQPA